MAEWLALERKRSRSTHHQAVVVVEDTAAVEERECESKDALEALLELVSGCALFVGQLVVNLVS
jgi:hypothetical protein